MKRILIFLIILLLPSAASATNWYVDNAASGANNGTSWTDAWESFAGISWASVSAGDTVYISGGSTSKTYAGSMTVTKNGSSGNRIAIRAGQDAGHNGVVIIDGGKIILDGRSYVDINGVYSGSRHIKFINQASEAISAESGASYLDIGYIESVGARKFFEGVTNTGVVIHHNYITDCDGGGGTGTDNYAIKQADPQYISGQENTYGGTGNKVHNNYVEVYHNFGRSGIGPDILQTGKGTDIYNNTLKYVPGVATSTTQHADIIQNLGAYVRIYNNRMENSYNAIIEVGTPLGYYKIYNNVMLVSVTNFPDGNSPNPNHRGIEFQCYSAANPGCTDIYILNNTIVDFPLYPIRILMLDSGDSLTNVEIKNNLIYFGTSAYSEPVNIELQNGNYTCGVGAIVDYNRVSNGAGYIKCDAVNYTQSHPQYGTPTFVSYTPESNNDLHLAGGDTAAKDNGVSLSSHFTTDFDSIARPQGAVWDIGAYEYASGLESNPGSSYGGATIAGGAVQ